MLSTIDALESVLRNLIVSEFAKPSEILCAFANVCCHGTVFEELGYIVKDKQLEKLFEGFDKSLAAARKMEK